MVMTVLQVKCDWPKPFFYTTAAHGDIALFVVKK